MPEKPTQLYYHSLDNTERVFIGPLLQQPDEKLTLSDKIIIDLAAINEPPYILDTLDIAHLAQPSRSFLILEVSDYISKRLRTNDSTELDKIFRSEVMATIADMQLILPHEKASNNINFTHPNHLKESWNSNKSSIVLGYGNRTIKGNGLFSYKPKDQALIDFTWQTPSPLSERLLWGMTFGVDYTSFFVDHSFYNQIAYADKVDLHLSGVGTYRYQITSFIDGFISIAAGALIGFEGLNLNNQGIELKKSLSACKKIPADNIVHVVDVDQDVGRPQNINRDQQGNIRFDSDTRDPANLGNVRLNPELGNVARCHIIGDNPAVIQLGYFYAYTVGLDIGGLMFGAQYKEAAVFKDFGPLRRWSPDQINSALLLFGWTYQN